MYQIIGVDGRQYGPVSADHIRQWVAEGRANALTLVQAEGSTEWRALVNFPELAGTLAAPPPIAAAPTSRLPAAEKKIPAGICGILLGFWGVHKFILGYTGQGLTMLLVTILTCGLGGPVMWIIGLIEGIIYLTRSDAEFVATYVTNKKGWF